MVGVLRRRRVVLVLTALGLLVILALRLPVPQGADLPAQWGRSAPQQVVLERRLISQASDVQAIAEDGAMAVQINGSMRAVYVLDPLADTLTQIARVPEGEDRTVSSVGISTNWVAWISASRSSANDWSLMATNRHTGETVVVARGDPTILLDTRPSAYLEGDEITWDGFGRDANGRVRNEIKLTHLPAGPVSNIARLEETLDLRDNCVGKPAVGEGAVVWFQGRRAVPTMFADVYLRDLSSETITKLNTSTNAGSPVVTRDYVVWMERSTEPDMIRSDIVLYDRRTQATARLNSPDDWRYGIENWNPNIGARFVSWWRGQRDAVYLYDLREKRLEVVADGFAPRLKGSFLAWVAYSAADSRAPNAPLQVWWARLAE